MGKTRHVPPITVETQKSRLKRNVNQFFRFGSVGIANTLIDFLVTNLLVFLTQADRTLPLTIISLMACLIATLNSYIWNKKWTFRAEAPSHSSLLLKFYVVSLIAALINTSVFLFFYHYLIEQTQWQKIIVINLAKLVGATTASLVSFLGFKLNVFDRGNLKQFQDQFQFDEHNIRFPVWIQLLTVTCLACVVRLFYLRITTTVFGDAVTYANIAQDIAKGNYSDVDPFWLNLFCFWEALFPLFGLSPIASAILASLIPGVFIAIPVFLIARMLYGDRVAFISGLLTATHPRLVEYSCNGYSETFYLFFLAAGAMWLIYSLKSHSGCDGFSWGQSEAADSASRDASIGVAFAMAIAVRNEAVLIMALCLVALLSTTHLYHRLASVAIGCSIILIPYVITAEYTMGTIGLLQKISNLSIKPSEQLDWYEGAKEAYSFTQEQTSKIASLFQRTKASILYTLQRLPGILITPTWLFALLLPFLTRTPRHRIALFWPLIVFLFFPLIFYPLVRVEPRYFFPILIPLQIFGAAGLWAFCSYLQVRLGGLSIHRMAIALVLGLSIAVVILRAQDVEKDYAVHRTVATWIDHNVPSGALLIGDGYGYAATTAFLAQHPSQARVWSQDPQTVVDFVRQKNGHWLILYEAFLQKSNPELLPVLSNGMPGMSLRFETRDWKGRRVQVYELTYSIEMALSVRKVSCEQKIDNKRNLD